MNDYAVVDPDINKRVDRIYPGTIRSDREMDVVFADRASAAA